MSWVTLFLVEERMMNDLRPMKCECGAVCTVGQTTVAVQCCLCLLEVQRKSPIGFDDPLPLVEKEVINQDDPPLAGWEAS
jgi:hypothetical protein